jgi:sugar-specific transcriptional regulator TrmB
MVRKKADEKELINTLTEIGLSLREARTYLSLLTRNNFTATEIAKAAGITRHGAYELLNKMIRLGMCKELIGKVRKFRAIQPGIAIPRLFEHYTEEFNNNLKHRQNLFESLKPVFDDMFEQSRDQKDPMDYFEILYDKNQIRTRYIELQKQAQTDIVGFIKPPYSIAPKDNFESEAIYKRGVKGRFVYEYEGNVNDIARYIDDIKDDRKIYGETVRFARTLPIKLQVFDSKISLLALKDPITGAQSLTTLIVTHGEFAMILKSAFEDQWAQAVPFDDFINNPNIFPQESPP